MVKYSFLLFVFFSLNTYSQIGYRVIFKDKPGCNVYQQWELLSDKTKERRAKNGVFVDEFDCPISKSYLDLVLSFSDNIKSVSKWLNTVIVESDLQGFKDSLLQFSFVKQVDLIYVVNSQRSPIKVLDEPLRIGDQSLIEENKYGKAYSEIVLHNGDLVHQLGYTGKGITIAVFDNGFTGVNISSHFQHAFQEGRIVDTFDFVNDISDVFRYGTHGTNAFSCISANTPGQMIGSAPDANYMLFITENNSSETIAEEYNWAEAAEYAEAQGADIFSTSLGYTQFDNDIANHTYSELNGNTTPITVAANIAASKGVLVINSAGNEGSKSWYYINAPADGSNVLAVGAVDSSGLSAGFSSHGPNSAGEVKPNVCAQGVGSAVVDVSGLIAQSNGTSFSCPIMSGLAACLMQAFPDSTASSLFKMLEKYSHLSFAPDINFGYGIPNLYNAILQKRFTSAHTNEISGILGHSATLIENSFTILFYQDKGTDYQLRCFDINGNLMFDKKFYLRPATFEKLILSDFESFASGVYFLQLNNDKTGNIKVIKR